MNNIDRKKYCLVLSKNFTPLGVKGVKKIMKYFVNEQGSALDPHTYRQYTFEQWNDVCNERDKEATIKTEKLLVKIPDIIVLNSEHNIKWANRNSISKRRIFERDKNRCVYCKCSLNSGNRTMDHVVPTSKGGSKSDHKNIVACCVQCNREKGDRFLEDLCKNGPHKFNNDGERIMTREDRWKIKTNLVSPKEHILHSIPKEKWLPSWEQFISFENL